MTTIRKPIAGAFALLVCGGSLWAEEVVYESKWEKPGDPVGPQWSTNGRIEITPNGKRTYLAYLGQRQASLHLTNLPEHELLRIECDLIVRGSWDGHISPLDDDRILIWLEDNRALVDSSFSNHPAWRMEKLDPAGEKLAQSFPLASPNRAKFKSCVGAVEVESLGYRYWEEDVQGYVPLNSVYRFVFHVPHTSKAMIFSLRCFLQNDKYETQDAGFDNVRVTALNEQANYPAAEWSALVKELEGEDAILAHAAMWKMLASPDQVREYLGGTEDEVGSVDLFQLVAGLADEEFKVRQGAVDKLSRLPREYLPRITALTLVHDDPETVVRLKGVIAKLRAEVVPANERSTGNEFKDRLRKLVRMPKGDQSE